MDINMTLVGQMITFLIFVGFTMKFVWPSLHKSLEERKERIAEGLACADRAARELEAAKKQSAEFLSQAKAEATKIVEDAHNRANKINEQAKGQAILVANRIKGTAMVEIEQEKLRLKEQLKQEFVALVVAGAGKVVSAKFDEQSSCRILQEFVDRV